MEPPVTYRFNIQIIALLKGDNVNPIYSHWGSSLRFEAKQQQFFERRGLISGICIVGYKGWRNLAR